MGGKHSKYLEKMYEIYQFLSERICLQTIPLALYSNLWGFLLGKVDGVGGGGCGVGGELKVSKHLVIICTV